MSSTKKTPLKQGNLFSFFSKKPKSVEKSKTVKSTTVTASTTASTTSATSSASSAIATATASTASTATTTTSASNNNKRRINSLWKQVQVGDQLRILWPADQQYYKATVLKQKQPQQFQVKYDDGETEWLDLSTEDFQFLKKAKKSATSTSASTDRKRKRVHIQDNDDDEEEEFDWDEKEHSSDNDDEDDDGSVFVAKDDEEEEDDEEDDEDQWMVTDDEDDQEITKAAKRKVTKKAKTTAKSLQVTEHTQTPSKPPRPSKSPPPTSSSQFKTPLRQFANTVSPNTDSTLRSRKSAGASMPHANRLPTPGSVTTSPLAARSPSQSQRRQALPYHEKGVNVQGAHVHNHLKFLQDVKDAKGRRPQDPGYNPKTLLVREADWMKHVGKMTNAVQQWWDLKSQYFDTVLLFKTGKFYEMFHMDADIGVDVLQLSYMKGKVAHAGFPESAYGSMADKLVRAGYKVARVEQTETPDQLKLRKAQTPKGRKKPNVVNREVCSIVSLGTRTFCALEHKDVMDQLDGQTAQGNATGPLLAIAEVLVEESSTAMEEDCDNETEIQPVCEYGITVVDAVRGTVTLGQFADDLLRSRMHTLLARLAPSEILYSETASPTLVALLKNYQSTTRAVCRLEIIQEQEACPKSTALDPQHRQQLERPSSTIHPWEPAETIEELHRRRYFPRASKTDRQSIQRWPAVLQAVIDGKAQLCMASFGAALFYLQRHLIDNDILSMGIVKAYVPETSVTLATSSSDAITCTPELQHALQTSSAADASGLELEEENASRSTNLGAQNPLASVPNVTTAEDQISYLSLDGTTLHNLEILTNVVDYKVAGSLWSKINYCKSPDGSRFLRAWLLRPLFRKADIDRRADAVQELASGAGAVALQEARTHVLGKIGDLDRLLRRIHAMSGISTAPPEEESPTDSYHPADRAVLYENAIYTKRKVNDFSKVLNGLRKASQIPELFADMSLDENGLLHKLVRPTDRGGCFPIMTDELDFFFENFDCHKAAMGLFEPNRGVDELFDQACDTIERIKEELEDYRNEMCQVLHPRHVAKSNWKYINTKPNSKDKYLIELPAHVEVPDDFIFKAKRGTGHKQVNKYTTSVVARLVHELEQALEVKETRKAKGMQLIFAKFDSKRSLWQAAAQATAMLDALGSLAKVAGKPGFCRPTILECPPDQEPIIDIVQGRHPCVESSSIHATEFIPNDLKLGGKDEDAARLLLLSGPNMGGKSTLLRQTCLITILAQLGSYVPAEACSLTPVDCIYTRLGASDRILLGQSTFFVELAETAAALRGATRRSLVIMDELGRGTSTFDGTAIAGATVKHLVERSQCLTLFATHYHSLLDEWKDAPKVRLGHMQCLVEDSDEKDADHSITFLYTLGPDTCPKSFGINVARLADLPAEVLDNAKKASLEFEEKMAGVSKPVPSDEDLLAMIHSGKWDELQQLWDSLQK